MSQYFFFKRKYITSYNHYLLYVFDIKDKDDIEKYVDKKRNNLNKFLCENRFLERGA